MRHKDEIAEILQDLLDAVVPDVRHEHDRALCRIYRLIDQMGAYHLIDEMLRYFGLYRISDCSPEQLSAITQMLSQAAHLESKRMHFDAPALVIARRA